MRRLVPFLTLAALLLVTGAARAAGPAYAPLDQPGPRLTVPAADLARSLVCTGDLRGARLTPVLLVPGTTLTPAQYSWNYARSFRAQGRPFCTVALPRQATGDIQVAGQYVVNAVRTMHARAGRKIDVVGHSQGGMVPRWALRFWPDTRAMVDDLVGLAPSNHGTVVSAPLCVSSCPVAFRQQTVGSRFLAALNSRTETFAGIDYTSVSSRYDEVVVPNVDPASGSSALRTGAGRRANLGVQQVCPADVADHLALGTYDAVGYALTLDALDHAGPAVLSRVPASVCTQPLAPGVDPLRFPANEAALLTLLAQGAATAPYSAAEPALAPYVFARSR
ncbi:MAG: lipase [Frankiales bacterium]|nr:lipase [Frankiales bacterium]